MDLIKYDMTNIWAVAGDVVAPDAAKIRAGWGVEVVPRQWWNWFENRQDNNLAYLLQKGIPEWDTLSEYIINKSYVQRNGVIYKAKTTHTGSDPVSLINWTRAFADYSAAVTALGTLTPATDALPYFTGTGTAATTTLTSFARTLLDDVDAATARATLSAQAANANLTAFSGVTAAVNGLPYFTATNAMGITSLTAFGRSLLDDADAATARTTLGLKGGAISDVSTTSSPTTAGLLLKVGDYGWGAGSNGMAAMDPPSGDLNLATTAGVYKVSTGNANVPNGFGQGALVLTMMWNNATGAQFIIQNGNSAMRGGTNLNATPAWTGWAGVWNSNSLVKTTSQTDVTAGAVMKVGDFGLGTGVVPAANDANAVTVTGFYACNSVSTITNFPPAVNGGNGMLLHHAWNGSGGASQTFITTASGGGRMFYRSQTSGGWQTWKETISDANIQPYLDSANAAAQAAAAASAANLYVPKTGGTLTGGLTLDNPASGQNTFVEIGNKTRSSTPFIDFNSNSGNKDYDSRILASGGSTTAPGQGALTYYGVGGHFFNGNITANSGYGFYGTFYGDVSGNVSGSVTGAAGSAAQWTTARTLTLTGAATGSVSWDGSANASMTTTIAISGVTGLQAALNDKLSNSDLSNTYYNKTQSDGRFVRLGVSQAGNGTFLSSTAIPSIYAGPSVGTNAALGITNGGNNSASAVMAFVRDGSFGTWFGLDTDNELAWGGWSHGKNRYRIWSEKNFAPSNYVTYAGLYATQANAIGSYAMAKNLNAGTLNAGDVVAGSSLGFSAANGDANGGLGGSWRCMGYCPVNQTSLFLRYA